MKKYSQEFLEVQDRLGDITESVGKTNFTLRLPRSLESRFIREGGRGKKTALMRQIIVRAVAEFPEWVAAIEQELEGQDPK